MIYMNEHVIHVLMLHFGSQSICYAAQKQFINVKYVRRAITARTVEKVISKLAQK